MTQSEYKTIKYLLKRVAELEELYKCRDVEVAELASLNQGQFLELEYLRPIFVAVEKILFMAEEYDFDDGLGRGAPQEYWDALEDAYDTTIWVPLKDGEILKARLQRASSCD